MSANFSTFSTLSKENEKICKNEPFSENKDFLSTQIITYLGNKRSLLEHISKEIQEIKSELKKQKLVCADIFSGSGVVSRMLKQHSSALIANDLESYSKTINTCYLTNASCFPQKEYCEIHSFIQEKCNQKKISGIITQNYAPKDDANIHFGERVFYTHENALLIDTYRNLIETSCPNNLKPYFLAPLITEASVHVNTSGVFKGFYKDKNTGIGCFGASGKNALSRIFGKIELKKPIFSNFECPFEVFQEDAVKLSKELNSIDITYLDPPYNQHPYGSNYFMLNLILKNRLDVEISKVSGITKDWNRSLFNKAKFALSTLEQIIENLDSKFIIISYNSEGFISFDQMIEMLKKYGTLKTVQIKYNTFRGSRNLKNRNIHVSEYLFVLKK